MDEVQVLLQDYKDIMSTSDIDIGHNTSVKHRIELSNELPFKQRYRKVPPSMIDQVRDHLQHLLRAEIIQKSHSPFASNVVLAKKKINNLDYVSIIVNSTLGLSKITTLYLESMTFWNNFLEINFSLFWT